MSFRHVLAANPAALPALLVPLIAGGCPYVICGDALPMTVRETDAAGYKVTIVDLASNGLFGGVGAREFTNRGDVLLDDPVEISHNEMAWLRFETPCSPKQAVLIDGRVVFVSDLTSSDVDFNDLDIVLNLSDSSPRLLMDGQLAQLPPPGGDVYDVHVVSRERVIASVQRLEGQPNSVVQWVRGGAGWTVSVLRDPVTQGSDTYSLNVSDVNGAGVIVGTENINFTPASPFILDEDVFERLPVGSAPGGSARGVNNHAVAVGYVRSGAGVPQQPVKWVDGILSLLPLPPNLTSGEAESINDAGQIVGACRGPGMGSFAVLWQPDGEVLVLDELLSAEDGLHLTQAVAVAENGAILCEHHGDLETKVVLLEPVE